MHKNWLYLFGFIAGVGLHEAVRGRVRIHFVLEEPEPNFAEEMLFDCPLCGMPAEVQSIMTHMGEGNDYINYYILNCLGDHDTAAVTEQWYRENVK